MITKKQLQILASLQAKQFEHLTLNDIRALSKEKSNNALTKALRQFSDEDLVTRKEVGNSLIYRLDMTNPKTSAYLSLANMESLNSLTSSALQLIIDETEKEPFVSLILFGSYAARQEKSDSDFDIALFIPDDSTKQRLRGSANTISMRSTLPIDLNLITHNELLQMLLSEDENLGKQIARKHRALVNPFPFYRIIEEAMHRGFHP